MSSRLYSNFLYKFINDKFLEEIKILKKSINVEKDLFKMKKKDYETLLMQLNENTARLNTDVFKLI